MLDHRDVIGDVYEPALIYARGDKDAFRSDRVDDMRALNANGSQGKSVSGRIHPRGRIWWWRIAFDYSAQSISSPFARVATRSSLETTRRASPTLG